MLLLQVINFNSSKLQSLEEKKCTFDVVIIDLVLTLFPWARILFITLLVYHVITPHSRGNKANHMDQLWMKYFLPSNSMWNDLTSKIMQNLNPTILVTKEIFSKFNDEIDRTNVFNSVFLAVSNRINQEEWKFEMT